MTLLPQPASELPPPPEAQLPPPDPTPRIRRYLLWSGWMSIGLALLSIALFGRDDFDIYLGLILLGGAPCFLYQRFSGTMRIVKWFWVLLTLPGWALLGFLLWHMGGALYLQATVPPVPASALTLPEYSPEQRRAQGELRRKFENAPINPAVQTLYRVWLESLSRPDSLDRFLAAPTTEAIINMAAPELDEFTALSISAPPLSRKALADERFGAWKRAHQTAQLVRRAWLSHQGRTSESQQLFLRQLETNLNHLSYAQPLEDTIGSISNSGRIVHYQMEHYPRLTRGIETEILALARRTRSRLWMAAADACGPAELSRFQQDFDHWLRETESPLSWNAFLEAGLRNRLRKWPFAVPHATVVEHARSLAQVKAALDPEHPDFRKFEMRSMDAMNWADLFAPNLGGNLASYFLGRPRPFAYQVMVAESTLAAYEYALQWQVGENPPGSAVPLDPATGAPYILLETRAAGVDTLVIAGGGRPPMASLASMPRRSAMEQRRVDLGITNAIYLFEVTRPAAAP